MKRYKFTPLGPVEYRKKLLPLLRKREFPIYVIESGNNLNIFKITDFVKGRGRGVMFERLWVDSELDNYKEPLGCSFAKWILYSGHANYIIDETNKAFIATLMLTNKMPDKYLKQFIEDSGLVHRVYQLR